MKKLSAQINSQEGVVHIFLVLLLILGISIGVYLTSQPQIFKPKASQTNILKSQMPFDASSFEGFGINSFIDPDYASYNNWQLPTTAYENIFPRANIKWVRVRVDWDKIQPIDPGENSNPSYDEDYLNKTGDLIAYSRQKGYSVEATLQNAPMWTDGWSNYLNSSEKQKYLKNLNLQINTGPLNEKGKQQLLLLSKKLFGDDRFQEVSLWGLYNEPNIPLDGLFTPEGGRVGWHGHFGFAITKDGRGLKFREPNADILINGPYEFAQLQKIFYQAKLDLDSHVAIGYTSGSMYAYVPTNPEYINRYDHTFDRQVLSILKQICPNGGCFDVMNFHIYPIVDKGDRQFNQGCHNPLQVDRSTSDVYQSSREDLFHCHDPYAFSEVRGKIRRMKYELNDILGFSKPIVLTELGKSWDHNSPVSEEAMMDNLIKYTIEAKSEGVGTIYWYELSGRNGDQGLFEHIYPYDSQYEPDKYPDGPVFATFAQISKMLDQYQFIKYGDLKATSRDDDPERLGHGAVSYVFKNKSDNTYREFIWNQKDNTASVINIPQNYTILKFGSQEAAYPLGKEEKDRGSLEITGNRPVMIEYTSDFQGDNPFGAVDSDPNLSLKDGRFIEVEGWVVSTSKIIDRVEIWIDGVKRGDLSYGKSRSDICRGAEGDNKPDFLYPSCPFVGFKSSVDLKSLGLSNGRYQVEVIGVDRVGHKSTLGWRDNKSSGGIEVNFKGLSAQAIIEKQIPHKITLSNCERGIEDILISWQGTVGRGAEQDFGNRDKSGFYVDISDSPVFETFSNKFVEGSQTNINGFYSLNGANRGLPFYPGNEKTLYLRVFNGLYSNTQLITPSSPSCK